MQIWQVFADVCIFALAHACAYVRACGLRGTLSKPLMGITRQSGRPCKAHLYIYIYIYACVCALQAYASANFSVLWYKRDNGIGFRRGAGDKKQCMSFRSKALSEEKMRLIADDCLRKLDAGEAVAVVKEWAGRQVDMQE
jgi:hypothetical protein